MVNLAGNFFGKFYSGQILTAIPGNSRSNLTCHCSAETEASFEVFAGDYLCIAGAGIRPRRRAKLSCRLSRTGNGNHGRWHIPDLRRKRIYGLPSGRCRDNRVRKSYPAKKGSFPPKPHFCAAVDESCLFCYIMPVRTEYIRCVAH